MTWLKMTKSCQSLAFQPSDNFQISMSDQIFKNTGKYYEKLRLRPETDYRGKGSGAQDWWRPLCGVR